MRQLDGRRHLWKLGQPRLWAGLLLSGVCLALAFRNVRPGDIVEALEGVDYWPLLVALGLQLFGYVLVAARWQILIGRNPAISVRRLLSLLLIGQLANTVLIARTGPLVRAVLLGRDADLDYATSLATVILEKVIDTLVLIGLFLVVIPFVPTEGWLPYAQAAAFAAVITLISVGAWLALRHRSGVRNMLYALAARLPWLDESRLVRPYDAVVAYLTGRSWRRTLPSLLGYSSLLWGVGVSIIYLVMSALDVGAPILASVLLMVILQLGARLPAAPANLGIFHYLCILVLSLFFVDKGTALSYGVVLHAVVYVPGLLLGAVYLVRYTYAP